VGGAESAAATESIRIISDSRVCTVHKRGLELWLSGTFRHPCVFVSLGMPWCGGQRHRGSGRRSLSHAVLFAALGYSLPPSIRTLRWVDGSDEWVDRIGDGGAWGIRVKVPPRPRAGTGSGPVLMWEYRGGGRRGFRRSRGWSAGVLECGRKGSNGWVRHRWCEYWSESPGAACR
jgi:hypothetical protein